MTTTAASSEAGRSARIPNIRYPRTERPNDGWVVVEGHPNADERLGAAGDVRLLRHGA